MLNKLILINIRLNFLFMKKTYSLSLIFLIFARLIFVYYSSNFDSMIFTKDSFQYIYLSEDIRNSFLTPKVDNYWINTFRLPGYPMILSFLVNFTDVKFIIFTNFIFDIVSCFLIFKIIYKLKKDYYLCFLGSLLFIINPNVLISSTQIMTENISMVLILIAFYFIDSEKNKNIIFSGFCFAIFALIKPFGVYMLLFIILCKKIIFKIKLEKIGLFALFPLIFIGFIYFNNFQNYNTSFYSTSSYFHIQWLNDASESLCDDLDFNNIRVSEPGYRFEEWKVENGFDQDTIPKTLIDGLREDSRENLFNNLDCKAISITRSSVWNMFGIRQSNWNNSFIKTPFLELIKIYSLIYVLMINFALFASYKFKKSKLESIYILFVLFYLLIVSILPFGNARTRVLIEPYLIIIFVTTLTNIFESRDYFFKKT